jgi:hypothetical protein
MALVQSQQLTGSGQGMSLAAVAICIQFFRFSPTLSTFLDASIGISDPEEETHALTTRHFPWSVFNESSSSL